MIIDKFAKVKFNSNTLSKYPISHQYIKSEVVFGSWFKVLNHSPDDTMRQVQKSINTEEHLTKSEKIRIHFDAEQRHIIEGWFKYYKKVYNIAIEQATKYKEYNFIKLRDNYVKPIYKQLYSRQIKEFGIPAHTLDNAINDVCKAYKTAKANLKAGNIKQFRLRPKRKCENKETIVIEGSAFSKNTKTKRAVNSFAFNKLGLIKSSKPFVGNRKDTRLTFDKRKNKFYMFLIREIPIQIKTSNEYKECSLDPGLRTFQTCYDKKNYMDLGVQTITNIKPILEKIDKVSNFKHTKWYKKYIRRLSDKLKNKIDELHWQVANFLTTRYNEITIGKLSTNIVSRNGNMSKLNKRLYYAQSHCTFRQRLQHKCNERGVKFTEHNEAYTSKKCGKCGKLNDVGASKVYNCETCGFRIGRDLNGARNIMIRKDMHL